MKEILKILLALLLLPVAAYAWLLFENNRTSPPPDPSEIRASFEKGVAWLEHNRDNVLFNNNVFLWWMLKDISYLSHNRIITDMVTTFEHRYLSASPHPIWSGLYGKYGLTPLTNNDLDRLKDYKKLFAAALYCDAGLRERSEIISQLDPGFCSTAGHWYEPACVTHQLMGLRILKARNCNVSTDLDQSISVLQDKIVKQLTLDTRMMDGYLQRVLTLIESGAGEKVKPIWLRRILDHQLADGGWSADQKIFEISDGKTVNFHGYGLSTRKISGSLHATAQGILIMALLLDQQQK